jgi:uncharacterized protein (DUF305 family)
MKLKRNTLIVIIIAALAIIGVGTWYLITDKQTTDKNKQQTSIANDTKTPEVKENKFAKLTGEAYDEAYIADMLAHHEGAINMAEMVSAGTKRQELIDLAQAIMQAQTQEVMKMQTWQQEWGYTKTMGGHGSHSGTANGMAGDMMMMGDELKDLKDDEFDKKFLSLMIEHHQQAVDMSMYADVNASHQEIRDLAKAVITAQEAEITQMKQWQKDWGFETTTNDEMPSTMPGMNH